MLLGDKNKEVVTTLLRIAEQRGLVQNILAKRNKKGKTALDKARKSDSTAIIDLLESYAAATEQLPF